jgi:Bacterial Ig-like domain
VFWIPTGFTVPAAYRNLIDRFVADIAADSGKRSNVFSSLTQFANAAGTRLSYKIHAGVPIADTTAFPANGCTADTGAIYNDRTGYTKCLTNTQLIAEANKFTTAKALPKSDLAHLYMYFLPKHVETCFTAVNGVNGGSCGINVKGGFCAYHAFEAPPLVASMNYPVIDSPLGWTCGSDGGTNTGGNQSPNGNLDADAQISIASHEIHETITDPQGTAWFDNAGFESGDECAYVYGDSTSFIGTSPAKHNEVINGHPYFLQEEPSIHAFSVNRQWACERRNQALVATIAPLNNATNVRPDTGIGATFDIAMNHAATQAAFTVRRTSNGAVVAGKFTWFGNSLVFKPNADLVGGVQYTANITTGAVGTLGDPIPAPKTWKFTVTIRPVLETTSPKSTATGVSRGTSVGAKFSKAMNHTTTQGAFRLKRTSSGVVVAGAFSWLGSLLIFNPTAALLPNTQYTASVSAAAKDTANNVLLNPTTWSFTTGAT